MYYPKPSGWTHVVLNYFRSNDEGLSLFYDGIEMTRGSSDPHFTNVTHNNRIVVGRRYTDFDLSYASIQIDELRFFNQNLTLEEISLLYYLDK